MERGQIVTLATVVIPPENTPQKENTQSLIAHPTWKYIGPADTIRFEWQIGRWGWAGFAGDTARKYQTFSQPASAELKEFTTSLPAISLSPLNPRDEPYDCEIWFKDKFSDLRVIVENCVKIIEGPVYEAPTIETLPATGIGGDSADLHGRLISAGSHEEARCHFEWGKTTSYGYKTPYVWLRSGDEMTVKLTNLEPNTTYHFRAVAYTTIGTDYGADRSFTTESVVTPGFQMRVINAPAGATQWRAGCVAGGALPYMPTLQPLNYVWVWDKSVPGYEMDFFVTAAGPWQDGFAPTIKHYQFPFHLRNDKRYVFDFGAWYPGIPDLREMMKEE